MEGLQPAWPSDGAELEALQRALAVARPEPWRPPAGRLAIGGCFVCFPRSLRMARRLARLGRASERLL